MTPRIADIQASVCKHFALSREDLLSRDRCQRIARPRLIAMHLTRRLTIKSFPQIGRAFERDHSSVIYADNEIKRLRKVDPELNDDIRAIVADLGAEA